MEWTECPYAEEIEREIASPSEAAVDLADISVAPQEGGIRTDGASGGAAAIGESNGVETPADERHTRPDACFMCGVPASCYFLEAQQFACTACLDDHVPDRDAAQELPVQDVLELLSPSREITPRELAEVKRLESLTAFVECSAKPPHDLVRRRQFFAFPAEVVWLSVALIGPSGAGKSRIIRSLLPQHAPLRPFSGRGAELRSTTTGIHVFQCPLRADLLTSLPPEIPRPTHYQLLDTEGSGGASMPITSEASLTPEHARKRAEYVKFAYPRFTYLFCNTLCFVFQGVVTQTDSYLQQVIDYANVASARSSKAGLRPNLILLFNKQDDNMVDPSLSFEECAVRFLARTPSDPRVAELQSLYSHIRVVYLPQFCQRSLGKYLVQLQQLQVELHQLQCKRLMLCTQLHIYRAVGDVFPLMHRVMKLLSRDSTAVLDMCALQSVDASYAADTALIRYFDLVHGQLLQTSSSPAAAHRAARQHMLMRLPSVYLLWLTRQGAQVVAQVQLGRHLTGFPPGFQDALVALSAHINDTMPCGASHAFPGLGTVSCEESRASHAGGAGHCSPKVYAVPASGIVATLYSWAGNAEKKPCRWPGAFDGDELLDTASECLTLVQNLDIEGDVVQCGEAIAHARTALTSPATTHLLKLIQSPDVCVACMVNQPAHRNRSCGHYFCYSCCEAFGTHCLLDGCTLGEVPNHALPRGAGYRVLALDGGGVRGLVSASILAELERATGLPSSKLFDYVIGTSVGGMIALSVFAGQGRCPAITAYDRIKPMIRASFQRAPLGVWGSVFSWPVYKRQGLHDALSTELGNGHLLGATPALPVVAVTATRTDGGQINRGCLTLFSSYAPPRYDDAPSHVRTATLVEGGMGTSAAIPYFAPISIQRREYVDGGFLVNNPCQVGVQEAAAFWPNTSLDMLLSVGTGTSGAPAAESHMLLKLFGMIVNLAVESQREFDLLKQSVKGHAFADSLLFRINPTMSTDFTLDDYERLDDITDDAQKYIRTTGLALLNRVADRLTACLFYLEPTSSTGRGTMMASADGNSGACSFILRSREPLDHSAMELIRGGGLFSCTYRLGDAAEHAATFTVPAWKSDAFGALATPVEIQHLPPLNANTEIIVRCKLRCLRCRGEALPDTWQGEVISGMPALLDLPLTHATMD